MAQSNTQRNIIERMKAVRLFAFDVDGVLTNGDIALGNEDEIKVFNVHDGAGMVAIMKEGYHVAWLTGRTSKAVTRRCQELGIKELHQGVKDKVGALEEICGRLGINMDAICYMGDDLNDLPAMVACGCAVAPKTATRDIIQVAHFVTRSDAGKGAAREAIETVLRTQGVWSKIVNRYHNRGEPLRQ